ncbi:MAG TPA: HEAT repeat domain-containing protein [Aggregatilineales bacterium]|nr:HEAT repeat domain-containing protein [Aggregatilineales bacterium]
MFDNYLRQLNSSESAIRRQAIVALANLGDPRALPALATIYRNDPDATLRELALKAGQQIKTRSGTSSTNTGAPTRSAMSRDAHGPVLPEEDVTPMLSPEARSLLLAAAPVSDVTVPVRPIPKPISDRERKAAKTQLDIALDCVTRGYNHRALDALTEAVRINRELTRDSMALSLASNLTAMTSPEQAMQMIVERIDFPPVGKGNLAIAGARRPREGAAIDPEFINLVLILIALLVVAAVFNFTLKEGLLNVLNLTINSLNAQQSVQLTDTQRSSIDLLRGTLTDVSLSTLLVGGLKMVGPWLIDIVLLYIVGVFMGGTGQVLPFLTRLLRIQVVIMVAYTALLTVVLFSFNPSMFDPKSNGPDVLAKFSVYGIVGGLILLVSLIWQARAVARNHDVGWGRASMIDTVAFFGTVLVIYIAGNLGFFA